MEDESRSSRDVERDSTLASTEQLRTDVPSVARDDVNTSSNDDAPDAAVAALVALRGMAETEAQAVESSLCEATALANPPEVAPTQKARNSKKRRRKRRCRRRQQQAGGDGEATAVPLNGNRLDAPLADERSDERSGRLACPGGP